MSNNHYISDLLDSLDLNCDSVKDFIPSPYPGTTSCFRYGKDRYNNDTKFLRLVAKDKDNHVCPYYGTPEQHESKGKRKIYFTHIANGLVLFLDIVPLVKRNAYGYRYFDNLRKRILCHLKFEYEFV